MPKGINYGKMMHKAMCGFLADVLALVGDFVPAFAPWRDAFEGVLLEAPDATTAIFTLAEPNAFFVESVTRTIGLIASPTARSISGSPSRPSVATTTSP